MRRVSLICLLLVALLLTGCSSRFAVTKEGYTDTKTDRHYVALSAAFEAVEPGEEIGVFEDGQTGRVVTFYSIPGADAARFLTDGDGAIYCADAQLPDPASWALSYVWVCEEDAISVAYAELTESALIEQIKSVWFAAQAAELPLEGADTVRRLKMTGNALPGIYYCINFYLYEDGSAYFYDMTTRRAVAVPGELAEKIPLE